MHLLLAVEREGVRCNQLWLYRGCFKAFATTPNGQRQEIFNYDNKGSFGELALMYYTQRQATVVSATTGTLWTLDRDTFRRLVLNRAHEKRLIYDRFLRTVPMLQTLTVPLSDHRSLLLLRLMTAFVGL